MFELWELLGDMEMKRSTILLMGIFMILVMSFIAHELTHIIELRFADSHAKIQEIVFLGWDGEDVGWVTYTTDQCTYYDITWRSELFPYTIQIIIISVMFFYLMKALLVFNE